MSKPYKQVSKAHFKVMALMFVVRDFFLPRDKVLEEAGIHGSEAHGISGGDPG